MMGTYQLDLKGRVVRERVVQLLPGGFVRVLEPSPVPAEGINVGFFEELKNRVKRKERVKRE